MANLLLDLGNYLIAQGIATTDGVDLFRDSMPDAPNCVTVLYEYSSGVPTFVADRSVQIIVRAETYEAARQASWRAFSKLYDPLEPVMHINTNRWIIVSARNGPTKLQIDAHGRTLFVFNLGICTTSD